MENFDEGDSGETNPLSKQEQEMLYLFRHISAIETTLTRIKQAIEDYERMTAPESRR